jgi:hypothetical protein
MQLLAGKNFPHPLGAKIAQDSGAVITRPHQPSRADRRVGIALSHRAEGKSYMREGFDVYQARHDGDRSDGPHAVLRR